MLSAQLSLGFTRAAMSLGWGLEPFQLGGPIGMWVPQVLQQASKAHRY